MSTAEKREEIRKRYDAFSALAFPLGQRTKEADGKLLGLLQSEIGSLILSYLETKGSLGSRQRPALEAAMKSVKDHMADYSDEGKIYFAELLAIAKIVLDSAHDQPSL